MTEYYILEKLPCNCQDEKSWANKYLDKADDCEECEGKGYTLEPVEWRDVLGDSDFVAELRRIL